MKTTYAIASALVWAAVATLPAQADVAKTNTTKASPVAASKKTDSVSASMAGTGVTLAYVVKGNAAVGTPLTIDLELTTTADADITMTADKGLSMNPASPALRVAAGQKVLQTLTVTPQADGLMYVNVFSNGSGRFATKSIPLQVGDRTAQQKALSTVQTTPSGERIQTIRVP
jgi:hypothetical protein